IAAKPGELIPEGSIRDTVFRVHTASLVSEGDSTRLDSLGTFVTLAPGAIAPLRIFAEKELVASLPPHLAPESGTLPFAAWRIRSLRPGSLVIGRPAGAGTPKTAAVAASAAWHLYAGQAWVKLDTLPGAGRVAR